MKFNPFKRKKKEVQPIRAPVPTRASRRRPMKLNVTAIRRDPIDIDGLASALFDLRNQLMQSEREKGKKGKK